METNQEKDNEFIRPIDVLNGAKGKRILVKIKNGSNISGILHALDLHVNIWLDDATEQEHDMKTSTKLGSVFIRGDNIFYVAPQTK
jgi:small nuclear ribonucleoprotein (snRNP)-like protein